MVLSNFILVCILISFGLFFYKPFLLLIYKKYPRLLVDDQFQKPQAFHDTPISTSGGAGILVLFLIVNLYFIFFKNVILIEYLSFCSLFFLLGFMDDLKININPKIRLLLMILFLASLIEFNNFYLEKTGIEFINNLLEDSKGFSLFFVCLCFLFIINGANLIDGYNGLLGIHSIIILINLFLVNYLNGNTYLSNFIFFQVLIILIFLIFNFPKAKVFLGDGGSYFVGAFVAISAIKTSMLTPTVSPFYFCIILFYLFFEVFFSFFRKLIKEKKSPIFPDDKHFHMLLYKMLLIKNKNKLKSNYYVSIIINFAYFILTIPAIIMMKNGLFCKYYSMLFFLLYIFSYMAVSKKLK